MRWLHYLTPMYHNKNGEMRKSDVWISVEDMILDSGKRKGMKMMGMTISIVEGCFIQPDEMLYLHFKDQKPEDGIRIGYISDEDHG